MRRILMIGGVAALLAVYASPASAVPMVNWTWDLEVFADDDTDTWVSILPNVDLGAPGYEYSWAITKANVYVDPPVSPQEWSVLDFIAPTGDSGTSDTLFIEIFSPFEPLVIDLPEIGAEITLVVLSTGVGAAGISSVDLRTLAGGGGDSFPVVRAMFGGTLSVTAIPEPATIVMLGLGSATLLGKRRRRA